MQSKASARKSSRKFYAKNRASYLRKNKERREVAAAFLREIKGNNPCGDCGGFFPPVAMDFDHVRGKKKGNLSALVTHGIEVVREELKKCELVCSNCHRVRTLTRLTKKSRVQHPPKTKAKGI